MIFFMEKRFNGSGNLAYECVRILNVAWSMCTS